MKIRASLVVLTLLPTCLAGSALAATKPKPKPTCNLVTDPAGDEGLTPPAGPTVAGNGNDDILSGDVASDGKTITGVIRLADLAQPDPQAPLGQGFFLRFNAKGAENQLFLSARTYPQGTAFVYGYSAADPTSGINTSYTLGTGTGVVDTAKKEVRISAPLAAFAAAGAKLVKGSKILAPTAETYRLVGQGFVPSQSVQGQRVPLGGFLEQFDVAAGTTSYYVGNPSCVKVGA